MHGELNKREFEGVFDRDKDNPWAWASTAARLYRAAEILLDAHADSRYPDGEPKSQEDTELDLPATLLYGYALENAIKGFLIKRHGGFDRAKAAHKVWGTHQLCELAVATGLPLDADQKLLLGSLQAFVRWAGRYPISNKKEQFTLKDQLWSGKYMKPMQMDASTARILDPFYRALMDDQRGV